MKARRRSALSLSRACRIVIAMANASPSGAFSTGGSAAHLCYGAAAPQRARQRRMHRILLITTIATVLSGLLCTVLKPNHEGPLPRGFRHPVIAAELVMNAAEIEQVYGTSAQHGACGTMPPGVAEPWDCAAIRMLRLNTWADFLFIACYGSMLFFLGRSLRGWLGLAITVL